MKRFVWFCAALLLALPVTSFAADGFVSVNANLRAGPDIGYPLIFTIPAGSPVSVQGCIDGYAWCDVIASGERGWVAGNYIQYVYQNQTVLLPSYGPRLGVPIIAFSIGAYWGSYYTHRPFYSHRDYWYHRPPPHRPPPPPPHRPIGRPPGHRPPGYRPPPSGTRPPGTRPPSSGQRPPGGHTRPPGNTRPPGHGRPTAKPAPRPQTRPANGQRPAPSKGGRPAGGGNRPQGRPGG